MTDFRQAHTLAELSNILRRATGRQGEGARSIRRRRGCAPTMLEWVAGQGSDLQWLGGSQRDRFAGAFRRCMEKALGDAFWDSNHTTQYGLSARDPREELGTAAPPAAVDDPEEALARTRPATFAELAGLVKKAAERGGPDRFRSSSHKMKTGRRAALEAPTFEQWAIKCGVRLTHLSRKMVSRASRAYTDLLEGYLREWFREGEGHRRGDHRASLPASGRLKVGERFRRSRKGGDGADVLRAWLQGRFVDFDESVFDTFLQVFPRPDPAPIIELATTTWETSPAKDGRVFRNFLRFLRRAAAVVQAMHAKPSLTLAQADDYVFHGFNKAYEIVQRLATDKGAGTIDAFAFAAALPTMPGLIDTSAEDLRRVADDVRARHVGADLTQEQVLQEVARRVQYAGVVAGTPGGPYPLKDAVHNALRGARADIAEAMATGRGQAAPGAYTQPGGVPAGAAHDVLHDLRRKYFGLQSTRDMVDRAVRQGVEPWNPRGNTWVVQDGYGGGHLATTTTGTDGLVRAVVNEVVAQNTRVRA